MKIHTIKDGEDLQKMYEAGTLEGLFHVPEEAYHAGPGLSQSTLKTFEKSPKRCKFEAQVGRKQTDAMAEGMLFDVYVTEGAEVFAERYHVVPDQRKGTKLWDEYQINNPGKILIKQKEWMAAGYWIKALSENKVWREKKQDKLTGQVCGYWHDGAVLRRCRIDLLCDSYVIDIKTCVDASEYGFLKANKDFGYWLQNAWYMAILSNLIPRVRQFYFCMVQKSAPPDVGWYTLTHDTVNKGLNRLESLIPEYLQAVELDHWPGLPEVVTMVDLPTWVTRPPASDQGVDFDF